MTENGENDLSSLPETKADLLERIQAEWQKLDQLVSQLNEKQLNVRDRGGWSIKDNLAHLATWEQYMILCYLQRRPAHQAMQLDEEAYKKLDETGLNEVIFRRNKNRSTAEVLKLFRDTHLQVLAALEKIPFKDLMKPFDTKDPRQRPVILWVIGNTYDHYSEHGATIQKIVQSK